MAAEVRTWQDVLTEKQRKEFLEKTLAKFKELGLFLVGNPLLPGREIQLGECVGFRNRRGMDWQVPHKLDSVS